MLRHASSNTMRSLRCRSAQTVEKMRSPLYSVLLLGIVGLLLVSREVGAQSPAPAPASAPPSGGGKGHFATSLCAELIISSEYNCIEYEVCKTLASHEIRSDIQYWISDHVFILQYSRLKLFCLRYSKGEWPFRQARVDQVRTAQNTVVRTML